MIAGLAGTESRISPPPLVRTRIPGNIRPNSSAVLPAPTTPARSALDPHATHLNAVSGAPHHPHARSTGPYTSSIRPALIGPLHRRHRAGVRHEPQSKVGIYPLRGTCTKTGASMSIALRAIVNATAGSLVRPPATSLACTGSASVTATICGASSRMSPGRGRISCAQPVRTYSATSGVRSTALNINGVPSRRDRCTATSRVCG